MKPQYGRIIQADILTKSVSPGVGLFRPD